MNTITPLNKAPFKIIGAPNVIGETVKRGDDDTFSSSESSKNPKSIVLRVYEAFGGHANATLRISGAFGVTKAYTTNLLEETLDELNIFRARDDDEDIEVKLDFRGFEVKTVKLVLGGGKSTEDEKQK